MKSYIIKSVLAFILSAGITVSFCSCSKNKVDEKGSTKAQSVSETENINDISDIYSEPVSEMSEVEITGELTPESDSTVADTSVSINTGATTQSQSETTADNVTAGSIENKTTKPATTKPTTTKPTTTKPTTTKPTTTKPTTTKPTTTKPTTTKPTTTKPETTKPSTDGIPSDSYLAKYFINIINSEASAIKFSVSSSGSDDPCTFYSSGDKKAAVVEYDGISAKVISRGSAMYICMPASAFSTMLETSEADLLLGILGINKNGGIYIDVSQSTDFSDDAVDLFEVMDSPLSADDLEFVCRSNVTKNGIKYVCEEYINSKGDNFKYYFSNNSLKIIESIASGKSAEIEIISISSSVPADAFDIPKGYKNMTSLLSTIPQME